MSKDRCRGCGDRDCDFSCQKETNPTYPEDVEAIDELFFETIKKLPRRK